MTPSWLTGAFAGLMLVVAAYCAARPLLARLRHRAGEDDIDALHVVMGVAMAGMLAARLHVLSDRIWEGLFAVAAVWFAVRIVLAVVGSLRGDDSSDSGYGSGSGSGCGLGRSGAAHHVPYLVGCGAMLYMYLAPGTGTTGAGGGSTSGGMAGMSGAADSAVRYPALGLLLAVFLLGYVVLAADRTAVAGSAAPGSTAPGSTAPGSHCSAAAPVSINARTRASRLPDGAVRRPLAPRTAGCCHLAMSITMAYMLISLL